MPSKLASDRTASLYCAPNSGHPPLVSKSGARETGKAGDKSEPCCDSVWLTCLVSWETPGTIGPKCRGTAKSSCAIALLWLLVIAATGANSAIKTQVTCPRSLLRSTSVSNPGNTQTSLMHVQHPN
ncbi:hypothetical protein FKM82_022229 [Ascaphus truei]